MLKSVLYIISTYSTMHVASFFVTFLAGLIFGGEAQSSSTFAIASSGTSGICHSFNEREDASESDDFWSQSSNCSPCAAHPQCGYCLSTLTCLEGDAYGPLDGSPCPNFLFEESEPHIVAAISDVIVVDPTIPIPKICPYKPQCDDFRNCDSCAAAPECAWCASRSECLVVSEVFSSNPALACRGTVFDTPCPASFVGVNRVVGNLIISQDPVFGGGELRVAGRASDGKPFELSVTHDGTLIQSARRVDISSSDNNVVDAAGYAVTIGAGSGLNDTGGSGGNVVVQAGAGYGVAENGGAGDGGYVDITGGTALGDGAGGQVTLTGGGSLNATGGAVEILSGASASSTSGSILVRTGDGGEDGPSGSVELTSGAARGGRSGNVVVRSGNAVGGPGGEKSRAGSIKLEVGDSAGGDGGQIQITAGKSLGSSSIGGAVSIESGSGVNGSGAVEIHSAAATVAGRSGDISMETGNSTRGTSGSIRIATGTSSSGPGGDIALEVGVTEGKVGGNVNLYAGDSTLVSGGVGAKGRVAVLEDVSTRLSEQFSRDLETDKSVYDDKLEYINKVNKLPPLAVFVNPYTLINPAVNQAPVTTNTKNNIDALVEKYGTQ